MQESEKILQLRNNHKRGVINIELPASKSIANRALMIDALAGGTGDIGNLSSARDTQTMRRLLHSGSSLVWDVLDAGTTMRFLTAYCAVMPGERTMTGTARMKERPIGVLVEALRLLGAEIKYLENAGYPPIHIKKYNEQQVAEINVRGDISSQYISALMMIGPVLPQGLELNLQGIINSRPYIDMTIEVMKHYGADVKWTGERTIQIRPGNYQPTPYEVEPDWSAASYWYSMASFAADQEIHIKGLKWESIQGDRKMSEIMKEMGIETRFTSEGAVLKKVAARDKVEIDFSDCPDIAQTVAAIACVQGIHCSMTGLESLRIKETDRIYALQQELGKIGGKLNEIDYHHWELIPPEQLPEPKEPVQFETYHDHRMAMSFAPLAHLMPIEIKDPSVVNKSYPHFWSDLEKAGLY